ncbi:MAG: ABC-F family ATP-binding cassette domain-containing protein [Terriglobia bacterium]
MLIHLNQIHKSFASKAVLQNVSFQVNDGDKFGLVGRNGSGKTTLFRLMEGSLEPDQGQVIKLPQVRIGLMQQIAEVDPNLTILESALTVFADLEQLANEIAWLESEIESKAQNPDLNSLLDRYGQLQTRWELAGGYSYEARTKTVLAGLGFGEESLGKKTPLLSGGERNRLNLAKLLLTEPSLLLLDEPTNHLDIDAVRWLENFLKDYPHAYVVVSHDRYFLDNTVDHILELANGRIEEYPGNYSSYIVEREIRQAQRQEAYEDQQAFIEKTEDFIRRNIAGQKTKQAKSRRKMLEKLERVENVSEVREPARFQFGISQPSGDLVLKFTKVSLGYDTFPLVREISLSVHRGQALGILGPNGSGKTTFLRAITGALATLQGKIQIGSRVELAYYEQQLSSLDPTLSVLEQMRGVAPLATEEMLRSYLARFLFRGEEVFYATGSLSGGEKSRLALAKLIYGKANTLILDEPTNHLDIPSCEALEEALQAYPGTLIIVSHDRYLINKLADQILFFDGKGSCLHFEGGYEDFEKFRLAQTAQTAEVVRPPKEASKSAKVSTVPGNGLSKNEIAKIRNRCDELEKEIRRVEALLETNRQELSQPDLAKDYRQFKQLSDQHEDLSASLDKLYSEWERSLALLEN